MLNRPPLSKQDRQARLIGLFLAAFFLFNFPLLGIFGEGEKWGSVPALLVYIGAGWIFLVFLVFLVMRGVSGSSGHGNDQNGTA